MEDSGVTDLILYLVLLGALALGWWLGRRSKWNTKSVIKKSRTSTPFNDYFIGLNYLLNDEPDDAIDIFIDALEVNSSTLETYMALGTLLRRRGKVDRSIAVYQDLLGQSGFSRSELNKIKINLVQSYFSAGLLDRAEHLLQELRNEKGDIRIKALLHSSKVYQQEKEWQKGVNALIELLKFCAPAERMLYQNLASHFYCELAELELENEHMSRARDYLRQAVAMDKKNVRVSILLGKLESSCGNYNEAIRDYLRVKKQDESFMADVFSPLVECYKKAGKEKSLRKFIDSSMRDETNATVILGLAEYLEKERGVEQARLFLLDRLKHKSSLRLLLQTIELMDEPDAQVPEKNLFEQVLQDYIESKAQYKCLNCGFELKTLHWHCPSCSSWGTVKHVMGILGE